MSNEDIRQKILRFLHLRRQAGVPVENRVRYLPAMLGISQEEFEQNVEYLHQHRFIEANAALRLDGGMTYLYIKLLEEGVVHASKQGHRQNRTKQAISV